MYLEGIFLPLTTPFHPDGRLFLSKLESNVARYSRTPVAGLHILGANSEAPGLTDTEACEILGVAIASATPEKVMLAEAGRESVFSTLALIQAANAVAYDAVTIQPPATLTGPSLRLELLTYYQTVADRSPLPILLVSTDLRPLAQDLVAELAGHPNILGLLGDSLSTRAAALLRATAAISREVDVTNVFAAATTRMLRNSQSSGLVSAASLTGGTSAPQAPSLKTRRKKVGFQLLTSNTTDMLAAFQSGVTGAIPRLGATAPQACYEVFQAWKDQDIPLAEEKQQRILQAATRTEGPTAPAWAKHGCDLNAYFGGRPRLPLLPLTATQRDSFEHDLATLHN